MLVWGVLAVVLGAVTVLLVSRSQDRRRRWQAGESASGGDSGVVTSDASDSNCGSGNDDGADCGGGDDGGGD